MGRALAEKFMTRELEHVGVEAGDYRMELREGPELVIVYPNYEKVGRGSKPEPMSELRTQPRLVWKIEYHPVYTGTEKFRIAPFAQLIWIDAITGEYVGGA